MRDEKSGYIFSVQLYGVWILPEATEKRKKIWRMCRIAWIQHITNLKIACMVKKRKLGYFYHIIRNQKYKLMRLIIEGKIEGTRRPERR